MDTILFGFTVSCGENEGTSASESSPSNRGHSAFRYQRRFVRRTALYRVIWVSITIVGFLPHLKSMPGGPMNGSIVNIREHDTEKRLGKAVTERGWKCWFCPWEVTALCGSEGYSATYIWSCLWKFPVKKQTEYLLFQRNTTGVFVGWPVVQKMSMSC